MFSFKEPQLDASFMKIARDLTKEEAGHLYKGENFVVVQDEQLYIVTKTEIGSFLESGDNSALSMIEWISRMQIQPSTTCQLDTVKSEHVNWARPVWVSGEETGEGVVTAEKMVLVLLKDQNRLSAYFEALSETVNEAVTAVTEDGEVICWNQVAERTYGIGREQILGRKIGEHFDTASIMLYQILDEGRVVRQVYHRPTPDTHVLFSASPIMEEGKIVGGVATEHDITRIVRLNEELYSAPMWIEQERPFDSRIQLDGAMQRSIKLAEKVAATESPVLLIGEQGTEKEWLAQAIHGGSWRKDGPFISLNCSAFPPSVLESELFGYRGGAFTGSVISEQEGKLELADQGTLFLEEIDALPLDLQVKLMQFIDQGQFYRSGTASPILVDTRIVASALPSIAEKWKQGQFRDDLYYKLLTTNIEIPPLRERTEDIPGLVQFFLRQFSLKYQKSLPKLDASVMTILMNDEWPGNVFELQQVLERLILLHEDGVITVENLPAEKRPATSIEDTEETNLEVDEAGDETSKSIPDLASELLLSKRGGIQKEAELIEGALRKTYGNKSAAAKLLGISRSSLYNKMQEYGLMQKINEL